MAAVAPIRRASAVASPRRWSRPNWRPAVPRAAGPRRVTAYRRSARAADAGPWRPRAPPRSRCRRPSRPAMKACPPVIPARWAIPASSASSPISTAVTRRPERATFCGSNAQLLPSVTISTSFDLRCAITASKARPISVPPPVSLRRATSALHSFPEAAPTKSTVSLNCHSRIRSAPFRRSRATAASASRATSNFDAAISRSPAARSLIEPEWSNSRSMSRPASIFGVGSTSNVTCRPSAATPASVRLLQPATAMSIGRSSVTR